MSTAVNPVLPGEISMGRRLGGFVALTKPRIIELLLVTTLPTMVVAARGLPRWPLMVATLVGGTLAAGGANAINMVVDRDIDAVMRRTRGRPLVTGVVSPAAALVFAIALEVLAFVELSVAVNLLSATLAVSATLFYVFVYTLWLKRTSRQNIVIGGAAGAVPVLVGWAAVRDTVGWAPVVLFALMFLWTPPHFWALAIKLPRRLPIRQRADDAGCHHLQTDRGPDLRLLAAGGGGVVALCLDGRDGAALLGQRRRARRGVLRPGAAVVARPERSGGPCGCFTGRSPT